MNRMVITNRLPKRTPCCSPQTNRPILNVKSLRATEACDQASAGTASGGLLNCLGFGSHRLFDDDPKPSGYLQAA